MEKKLPWKDIYKDFRARFPTLRKNVLDWRPYGPLTIILYCKDKTAISYEYDTKHIKAVAKQDIWH